MEQFLLHISQIFQEHPCLPNRSLYTCHQERETWAWSPPLQFSKVFILDTLIFLYYILRNSALLHFIVLYTNLNNFAVYLGGPKLPMVIKKLSQNVISWLNGLHRRKTLKDPAWQRNQKIKNQLTWAQIQDDADLSLVDYQNVSVVVFYLL